MSKIEVDELTKEFGETVALEDVSFEIEDGEFVVVLGVSGSGKSTLLRCLSGLIEPTSGEIVIDGTPVTGTRKEVAMIFQQHNIIGDMSAYANALSGAITRSGFFTSFLRTHSQEEKETALQALKTVDLLDEAQQKARRLSGGQQQRVGVARALVQQPDVLLADEPVSSLDPGSSQQVMRYLQTAADERNLTALISLHQVNLARKFGQRFIGLRDGKKVFDGYRDELTIDVVDEIYGDIETEGMFVGSNPTEEATSTNEEATP
jgi:phosphonate transport system ATP-binding protein